MNRGCVTLFGLGLLSLFVFGVTLEALNDPKELSASPYLYRAPSPPALSLKIRNGCLPLPHVTDIDERV
jgi:hypothetical protein